MNTTNTNKYGVSEVLPFHHIEALLEQMRTAQYSEVTLRKKRWVLTAFARWMSAQPKVLRQQEIASASAATNWHLPHAPVLLLILTLQAGKVQLIPF
jgi:hypothetical protein